MDHLGRKSKKKPRKKVEKRAYYSDRIVPVNPLEKALTGKLSLSLAYNGKLAAIGSDQGLFLIDLDSQERAAAHTYYSDAPVTTASWNPHETTEELLASCCGDEVSIWNTERTSHPLLYRFQAHKFPVKDVAWSPLQPSVFSTCSETDPHFYFWDQRKLGRPVLDFSPPGNVGSDMVVWHTRIEHLVATAHKGVVQLWDTRKGILASINAHRASIDSLQWSPSYDHFVTCSQLDHKLRFWSSITHDCLYNLQTKQPTHSVLYTPFGDGLVTASDSCIRLWRVADLGKDLVISDQEEVKPVHTFSDSLPKVEHVAWRRMTGLPQLVNLGEDHTLHLWNITSQLQKAVPKSTVESKAASEEIAEEGKYLEQEVKAIGDSIPGIKFTKVNLLVRVLDVEFTPFPRSPPLKLRIDIPEQYPYNIAPLFTFKESNLGSEVEARIIADMAQVGSLEVERARSCLSQCLRHLSQNFMSYLGGQPTEQFQESGESLEPHAEEEERDNKEEEDSDKEIVPTSVHLADEAIICPRLCGAVWSMQGKLIYFNNFPAETQRLLDVAKKKEEAQVSGRQRKRSSKFTSPETSDHSEAEEQYNTPIEDYMDTSRVFVLPHSYLDLRKRLLEGNPADLTSEDEGSDPLGSTPLKRAALGRADSRDSNDSILAMDVNSLMESISKDTQRQTDSQLGSSAALPLTEGEEAEEEEGDGSEDSDVVEDGGAVEHVPKEDRFFKAFAAKDPLEDQLTRQVKPQADDSRRGRAQNTSIVVADLVRLLPATAQLAHLYVLHDDLAKTCARNSDLAKSCGRSDLAHSWSLAGLITKPRAALDLSSWEVHPFGGQLARRLLESYAADIQMFALLSCVFEAFRYSITPPPKELSFHFQAITSSQVEPELLKARTVPIPASHEMMVRTRSEPTMHHVPADKGGLSSFLRKGVGRSGTDAQKNRHMRRASNSSTERHETSMNAICEHEESMEHLPAILPDPVPTEKERIAPLLPVEDMIKLEYAEYLSRIGAHQQRAELLKFSAASRLELSRKSCYDLSCFSVQLVCQKCMQAGGTAPCIHAVLVCGICRISVRGLTSVCLLCQHGGHPHHIKSWFDQEESCPMGCGCNCRQNASLMRLEGPC